MEIVTELVLSIFLGFGLFILSTTFVRFKNEGRNELITQLTESAVIIASLGGIAYLIIWIADLYGRFQIDEEYYALLTRLTGPYWFGYWIYPISYGIIPQILWVRKVRSLKAIRIIVALLFLFALHIEKIVIMLTSLHRDYLPASWTMLPGYSIVYDWIASLIVFSLALALMYFVRTRAQSAGFERK